MFWKEEVRVAEPAGAAKLGLAGAGDGKITFPLSAVGWKVPETTGLGIPQPAASSNVTFRPLTGVLPPASPQKTRFVPVGPVRSISASVGNRSEHTSELQSLRHL